MTFIPETFREFFGDTWIGPCPGDKYCHYKNEWKWGTRHYWYNITLIFLMLWTLVGLIAKTVGVIKDEYGPFES